MWPSWMSFRWMDGFHHHLFQDIGSLCHFLDFSFFFITRVYIITTNFRYNFFSGHKCDDLWPLSFSLWSAFMFVCSWFFFYCCCFWFHDDVILRQDFVSSFQLFALTTYKYETELMAGFLFISGRFVCTWVCVFRFKNYNKKSRQIKHSKFYFRHDCCCCCFTNYLFHWLIDSFFYK